MRPTVRPFRNQKSRQGLSSTSNSDSNQQSSNDPEEYPIELTTSLKKNLDTIKQSIGQSPDVVIREFLIGNEKIPAAIIYVDELVDKQTIQAEVLRALMTELPEFKMLAGQSMQIEQVKVHIQKQSLTASEVQINHGLDDLSLAVLSGNTVLLLDGSKDFLKIGSRKFPSRSIDEPTTEASVRGPRDAFVEVLPTNMGLIRRRLRDPNLKFDSMTVGRRSKTDLVVAYVAGIAQQELVDQVKKRISAIDIDEVPDTGYIEQLIEDNFLSPFPQLQHTERPDKIVSAILEGRVAIMMDGTPYVLIAPVTIAQLLQAPEDYYDRWIIGSLIRMLRYLTAFISVFLPSLYIALVSYHPGLIPTKLALSIAATREGVPFPAAVEAFIMEITIEILREAGLRLPKQVGPTVGIVGGLVIGEAAVRAGIVSPIMVIIVALGAIASFSMPSYSVAITFRVLRFGFMLSASLLGLYGVIIAYIFINVHLVRLSSFGNTYSVPFAPYKFRDWKDLVVRLPLTIFKKRPASVNSDDEKRMV